jgi:hypothetical protein
MKTTIKLMLLAAFGAALVAAPVSAKAGHWQASHSFHFNSTPGVFLNNTVIDDGQYLGRDPDPNVRSELRRDDGAYNGND